MCKLFPNSRKATQQIVVLLVLSGTLLVIFQQTLLKRKYTSYTTTGKTVARGDHNIFPSAGFFQPQLAPSISPAPLEENYLLVVGISTVARYDVKNTKEYVSYVIDAIESLIQQIEKSPPNRLDNGKLLVFVQDNTIDSNPPFDYLLKKLGSFTTRAGYDILLFKNDNRFWDPFQDVPDRDYTTQGNELPGHNGRQQTADVISLVLHALKHIGFQYFLFMEDDFITCENMVYETMRVLREINSRDPNHCGMRVSYGMDGVLLPRMDLVHFITYLSYHIDMLPVDLMIRRFIYDDPQYVLTGLEHKPLPFQSCKAQGRIHYTYKTVLQEHIGAVSTFGERNDVNFRPSFPNCGYTMASVWNLDSREQFDTKCNVWSVSPCKFDGPVF